MHIKPQTVIPPGTKITICPANTGSTRSLYSLERAQEKKLERAAANKERAQAFAAALKEGYSVKEALEMVKGK
jgi:hypothetical protein